MSSADPGGAVVSDTSTWSVPTERAAAVNSRSNTEAGVPWPEGDGAHVPLAKLPLPSLTASHGTYIRA
jgi:hypothetical protein